MRIVLAPYSTRLSTGNPNPKNPPEGFWQQVVLALVAQGHEVIQIGTHGEERIIGTSMHVINWPLKKLRPLIDEADCFLTVDSFLPHFVWAWKLHKRGVVIFSLSDPLVWGHPENINLLKGREYLRPLQYQTWNEPTYNADAFVSPEEVVDAVESLIGKRPTAIPVFVARATNS